jgi:hypothetical protein
MQIAPSDVGIECFDDLVDSLWPVVLLSKIDPIGSGQGIGQ